MADVVPISGFELIRPTVAQLRAVLPSTDGVECARCARRFANRSALHFHAVKVHADIEADGVWRSLDAQLGSSAGDASHRFFRFACPSPGCGAKKSFAAAKLLVQHFQKAHTEKRLRCERCAARFSLQRDLNYHHKKTCAKRPTAPSNRIGVNGQESFEIGSPKGSSFVPLQSSLGKPPRVKKLSRSQKDLKNTIANLNNATVSENAVNDTVAKSAYVTVTQNYSTETVVNRTCDSFGSDHFEKTIKYTSTSNSLTPTVLSNLSSRDSLPTYRFILPKKSLRTVATQTSCQELDTRLRCAQSTQTDPVNIEPVFYGINEFSPAYSPECGQVDYTMEKDGVTFAAAATMTVSTYCQDSFAQTAPYHGSAQTADFGAQYYGGSAHENQFVDTVNVGTSCDFRLPILYEYAATPQTPAIPYERQCVAEYDRTAPAMIWSNSNSIETQTIQLQCGVTYSCACHAQLN